MSTDDLHPVFLGNPGESASQVLVVTGAEVVIPLEMDVDGDPLQDDEVRLRHVRGAYTKVVRASDADAEPQHDKGFILYRFRHVPPGLYTVSTRIGGRWVDVLTGLRVGKDGVFYGDQQLGETPPDLRFESDGSGQVVYFDGEPAPEPAAEGGGAALPEYIDLNPSFRDREGAGR